ncbi:hypothetical protein GQ457_03G038540 [Hibiscus cannabinus]
MLVKRFYDERMFLSDNRARLVLKLNFRQLRNLEKAFGGDVRVCDRTALILDIFNQRAATHEAALQASSDYLFNKKWEVIDITDIRLKLHWLKWNTNCHVLLKCGLTLSVKLEGMGEKQIEVDKRILRTQVSNNFCFPIGVLKKELESVRKHRKQYRNHRFSVPVPVVSLVGYTNAGKSTLLNYLTGANVLSEDRLFATLDPTTRRVQMKIGSEFLLTDTVGFIQKLPITLMLPLNLNTKFVLSGAPEIMLALPSGRFMQVAAFRATLEEISESSLLVHVVDISHPLAEQQVDAVEKVLAELDVSEIPKLMVWNKVDRVSDPQKIKLEAERREDVVCISALTGEGLQEFCNAVHEKLKDSMVPVEALLPFDNGGTPEYHTSDWNGGENSSLIATVSLAHPGLGFGAPSYGLFPQFYQFSCLQADDIVMLVLKKAIAKEPRMAASLLRLHFHDCFVQGCDASILLDDSATIVSEKNALPNRNSIRGFEVIDEIKAKLEEACPQTVSCADILAMAARGSTVLSGGPSWELPLGRKDSKIASLSTSNNNIPPPNSTLQNLITLFQRQGLDEVDLVALSGQPQSTFSDHNIKSSVYSFSTCNNVSGGHTIGVARCATFKQRLYNQNGNNLPDETLERTYYNGLKSVCPKSGGDNNISPLDFGSPVKFDNLYFKLILWGKGLLNSDEVLLTGNVGNTMELVKAFAEDENLFFKQFATSMIKMGNINPLTGFNGEVRKNCRYVN